MLREGQPVRFSHKIKTKSDPKTTWAMRLDHYVKLGNDDIHLAAIVYSTAIILLLGFLISAILRRQIYRDFGVLDALKE